MFYRRHNDGDMNMPPGMSMGSGSWDDLNPGLSTTLYLHIGLALLVFGFLLPFGITLGIRKSINKYHIPIQILNTVLIFIIFFLGLSSSNHKTKPHLEIRHEGHHGRVGKPVHKFVGVVIILLILFQSSIGIIRKVCKLFYSTLLLSWTLRCFRILHKFLGLIFLVLGYSQIILGFIVATDACGDDNVANCTAHLVMG
ncbi:hypothetical protein HDU92_006318, partial [Lobulomyces angularis]